MTIRGFELMAYRFFKVAGEEGDWCCIHLPLRAGEGVVDRSGELVLPEESRVSFGAAVTRNPILEGMLFSLRNEDPSSSAYETTRTHEELTSVSEAAEIQKVIQGLLARSPDELKETFTSHTPRPANAFEPVIVPKLTYTVDK